MDSRREAANFCIFNHVLFFRSSTDVAPLATSTMISASSPGIVSASAAHLRAALFHSSAGQLRPLPRHASFQCLTRDPPHHLNWLTALWQFRNRSRRFFSGAISFANRCKIIVAPPGSRPDRSSSDCDWSCDYNTFLKRTVAHSKEAGQVPKDTRPVPRGGIRGSTPFYLRRLKVGRLPPRSTDLEATFTAAFVAEPACSVPIREKSASTAWCSRFLGGSVSPPCTSKSFGGR